jgi:sugar/nucleoside kinase (ribokinase family)
MNGSLNHNHATKRHDLSAISTLTLETIDLVDHLTIDGRCILRESWPEQPGGLAYYALRAIRSFDPDAPLAIAGLVGGRDRQRVLDRVRHLGAETRCLMPIPGKWTNRSRVILGPANQKIIIRCGQAIRFEGDLNPARRRKLEELIKQSHACLLGNLPVDLTAHLIDYGRAAGTYMILGAGHKQFGHLAELRPHALLLNQTEARHATGLTGDDIDSEVVFDALLELSPTDHLVVMTGQGRHNTFIAERFSDQRWQLAPERLHGRNGHLYTLGAGDTMAGVVAFLLGQQGRSLSGAAVRDAVEFAQAVVSAHLTQQPADGANVRALYGQIWDSSVPQPALPCPGEPTDRSLPGRRVRPGAFAPLPGMSDSQLPGVDPGDHEPVEHAITRR